MTYLAQDTNLNLEVAIKEYFPVSFAARGADHTVLPTAESQIDDFNWGLKRFIEEGQTLARFDHPAIVRVMSVFEEHGTAYLVMRYEHGRPLSLILDEGGALSEQQAVAVALQLIEGLRLVHEAGFIHRDIKPANIYLREDGSPVLLDFGSARQALGSYTHTLTTMVSPGYAPYEQYLSDSEQQGPWTDIYALAATLYRATCGVAPMAAIDRSKTLLHGAGDYLVSARELGAGRYSDSFLAAVDHALAFRETDRPQDLLSWSAELTGETAVSVPSSIVVASNTAQSAVTEKLAESITQVVEAPPPRRWKRKLLATIAALFVGAGAAMLSLRIWLAPPDKTEPQIPTASQPAPDISDASVRAPPPSEPATPEAVARVEPRPQQPTTESRISALLWEAETDLFELRLTTPRGNNAYDKYQTVLELEPGNLAAREGIREIGFRYMELAQESAKRSDWPEMFSQLKKARQLDPENKEIARAERRLRTLIEKRSKR